MSLEKGIQKAGQQVSAALNPPAPGEVQYQSVKRQIQLFEASLDRNWAVGLRLASFGSNITINVDSIEWDGAIFIFHGWSVDCEGVVSRVTLLQHTSQLNFLLVATPRPEPEKPRPVIGFTAN